MYYSKEKAMETVYEFWGGKFDGQQFNRDFVERFADGHTADNSLKRSMGCVCPRRELDSQPKFDGYYGPMYDGIRHILKDGSYKHDWEVIDNGKIAKSFIVLRYETEEVYENMGN